MMRGYVNGGDVEDTALDPQSSAASGAYKQMLTDTADPTDTAGIQPVASPVDLLAGGVGASIPNALESGGLQRAIAGATNPLDDLAALMTGPKASPQQGPMAADVAAYKQTGVMSPRLEQAIAQGDNAIKITNALEATPPTPTTPYAQALNKAMANENDPTLPPNVYKINEAPQASNYEEAPDKFANLADMIRKKRQ